MIEWLMGISILLFLESSTVAKSLSSMNTSACVTYQLSMLTPGGGGGGQGVGIWQRSKNSCQFHKGGAAYVHQVWIKIPSQG